MPLLNLLYYHKADVTSQTFALCSQNDVLHDACQSTGHVGPKTRTPRTPRRDPTFKKIIKEDGPRLQPTLIEDGVGDVILSSATGVLKVASYGRKVDATRNIEERSIHNSFKLHASFAAG